MNEVVNFGCRLNSYESEVIKDLLKHEKNEKNLLVINSCAVTKEAERQTRQFIRKTFKNDPNKKIIVTGCAAQIDPKSFAIMPEVSKVIGNQEKLLSETYFESGILANNEKILVNDIMSVKETAGHLVSNFEGKVRGFLQIQNGCNHRCTFCTIPYGRGNSRSVGIGEIVNQAKLLVSKNYHEITLTGVDITDYGKDLPIATNLGKMIKKLLNLVPDLSRIRLSSIDVAEIDDELLELMKYEERLMPHFHISLQAGDDMILKRMKRRHNRQQVIDFCDEIRKFRDNVSYGADMIAGFPTENEEMFNNSLNLIHEANLQFLHVFPFSSRQGTPASRMPQLSKDIKKQRAAILREAGNRQLQLFLKQQIGKKLKIIVENNNIARAENFLKVKLDKIREPGEIVESIVKNFEKDYLIAELCD